MGKLYVAYGSNLNLKQMAYRCPSASIYGTGQLTNWELLYRGSATNSHATIAKKHGSYVPVLLWNIEPEDEKRLDIYEGYPRYYYKQNVMVDIGGKKKRAIRRCSFRYKIAFSDIFLCRLLFYSGLCYILSV